MGRWIASGSLGGLIVKVFILDWQKCGFEPCYWHDAPASWHYIYGTTYVLRGVSTCASALASTSSSDSVMFLLCVSTSTLALALLCYQASHWIRALAWMRTHMWIHCLRVTNIATYYDSCIYTLYLYWHVGLYAGILHLWYYNITFVMQDIVIAVVYLICGAILYLWNYVAFTKLCCCSCVKSVEQKWQSIDQCVFAHIFQSVLLCDARFYVSHITSPIDKGFIPYLQ